MSKAIKITLTKAEGEHDLAASKLFGAPVLPEGWQDEMSDEVIFFGQIRLSDIAPFDPKRLKLPEAVTEEVEIQIKYAGYLARQEKQVEEFKKEESRLLPADIDYDSIVGLRLEAREKLQQIRPMSIGQAGRISGVSPADIAVLLIWLEQR